MHWRYVGIAGLATVLLFAAGEKAMQTTLAQNKAGNQTENKAGNKAGKTVRKALSGKGGEARSQGKSNREVGNSDDMGAVTPEREAAALKFVELHHKELLPILHSLQSVDQVQYERAVEEIFRASEKLARMKSRSLERYEFELKLWKLKSRRNLLIASLPMTSDYEQTMGEIEKTISRELKVQNELLEFEAQMTRKRLTRIEETLKRQQDNLEANINRQLQRIRKVYPPSEAENTPSGERRNKEKTE